MNAGNLLSTQRTPALRIHNLLMSVLLSRPVKLVVTRQARPKQQTNQLTSQHFANDDGTQLVHP